MVYESIFMLYKSISHLMKEIRPYMLKGPNKRDLSCTVSLKHSISFRP